MSIKDLPATKGSNKNRGNLRDSLKTFLILKQKRFREINFKNGKIHEFCVIDSCDHYGLSSQGQRPRDKKVPQSQPDGQFRYQQSKGTIRLLISLVGFSRANSKVSV